MARCADAMGRLSDLNDVSDAFYLEAMQKCVSALRTAEHDAEGTGTKAAVADALAVSAFLSVQPVASAPALLSQQMYSQYQLLQ